MLFVHNVCAWLFCCCGVGFCLFLRFSVFLRLLQLICERKTGFRLPVSGMNCKVFILI